MENFFDRLIFWHRWCHIFLFEKVPTSYYWISCTTLWRKIADSYTSHQITTSNRLWKSSPVCCTEMRAKPLKLTCTEAVKIVSQCRYISWRHWSCSFTLGSSFGHKNLDSIPFSFAAFWRKFLINKTNFAHLFENYAGKFSIFYTQTNYNFDQGLNNLRAFNFIGASWTAYFGRNIGRLQIIVQTTINRIADLDLTLWEMKTRK